MNARTENLAQQLEQVNAETIAAVEACDEAAWRARTAEENWPVAFAAWHIAEGHASIMGLIAAVANGQAAALPPITADMLAAANAEHLASHPAPERTEVLEMLRRNGAGTAATSRALTDEQLDRTVTLALLGDRPMTVEQLIGGVFVGHARNHLQSIRSSIRAAV